MCVHMHVKKLGSGRDTVEGIDVEALWKGKCSWRVITYEGRGFPLPPKQSEGAAPLVSLLVGLPIEGAGTPFP